MLAEVVVRPLGYCLSAVEMAQICRRKEVPKKSSTLLETCLTQQAMLGAGVGWLAI